jgi:hypothetical protein
MDAALRADVFRTNWGRAGPELLESDVAPLAPLAPSLDLPPKICARADLHNGAWMRPFGPTFPELTGAGPGTSYLRGTETRRAGARCSVIGVRGRTATRLGLGLGLGLGLRRGQGARAAGDRKSDSGLPVRGLRLDLRFNVAWIGPGGPEGPPGPQHPLPVGVPHAKTQRHKVSGMDSVNRRAVAGSRPRPGVALARQGRRRQTAPSQTGRIVWEL